MAENSPIDYKDMEQPDTSTGSPDEVLGGLSPSADDITCNRSSEQSMNATLSSATRVKRPLLVDGDETSTLTLHDEQHEPNDPPADPATQNLHAPQIVELTPYALEGLADEMLEHHGMCVLREFRQKAGFSVRVLCKGKMLDEDDSLIMIKDALAARYLKRSRRLLQKATQYRKPVIEPDEPEYNFGPLVLRKAPERTLEQREDPKSQMMELLFDIRGWTAQQLLEG